MPIFEKPVPLLSAPFLSWNEVPTRSAAQQKATVLAAPARPASVPACHDLLTYPKSQRTVERGAVEMVYGLCVTVFHIVK